MFRGVCPAVQALIEELLILLFLPQASLQYTTPGAQKLYQKKRDGPQIRQVAAAFLVLGPGTRALQHTNRLFTMRVFQVLPLGPLQTVTCLECKVLIIFGQFV